MRNQKEVYEGHIHYAPQRIKYPVQSFTHLQFSISQGIMFEDFKLIWKIIDPSFLVLSDCKKNWTPPLKSGRPCHLFTLYLQVLFEFKINGLFRGEWCKTKIKKFVQFWKNV